MRLLERLGQERNADHQLGAGADTGEEAVDREIPNPVRQALHCGKDGVDGDAVGQCPDPADIIGDHTEQEAAKGPAEQAGHAQKPAGPADLGHGRVAAEKFGHRRAQYQRVKPKIRRVQCPAEPDYEKDQPLIAADRTQPA